MSTAHEIVQAEVSAVYDEDSADRAMFFLASQPLPIIALGESDNEGDIAVGKALFEVLDVIGEYNNFDPGMVADGLVDRFPACNVIIGREYSVVIYVVDLTNKPRKHMLNAIADELIADEINWYAADDDYKEWMQEVHNRTFDQPYIRIWWD